MAGLTLLLTAAVVTEIALVTVEIEEEIIGGRKEGEDEEEEPGGEVEPGGGLGGVRGGGVGGTTGETGGVGDGGTTGGGGGEVGGGGGGETGGGGGEITPPPVVGGEVRELAGLQSVCTLKSAVLQEDVLAQLKLITLLSDLIVA